MPNEVNTLDDVRKFFTDLKAADYIFHPDDDFTEYSNTNINDGKLLNVIMQRCWVICEDQCTGTDDIYTIAINIQYPENTPIGYLL